jgi:transposase-like protein
MRRSPPRRRAGVARAAVQRCCVHTLRNLERKAPKHALAAIRDDFHQIVYAASAEAARTAYTAFERMGAKRCPGVVTSLREGGDELLTFFRLSTSRGTPPQQIGVGTDDVVSFACAAEAGPTGT